MNFPAQVKVQALSRQHDEYAKCLHLWEKIRKLYIGGHELHSALEEFLHRRPAEKTDVYTSRLREFTYTNILQAIIGWYISAEFKESPAIVARREDWEDRQETADALEALRGQVARQAFRRQHGMRKRMIRQ